MKTRMKMKTKGKSGTNENQEGNQEENENQERKKWGSKRKPERKYKKWIPGRKLRHK